MRRPDGVFICTDASGKETHIDAFMCVHCGLPKPVDARSVTDEIGGFCRLCFGHVCPACLGKARCAPFEKQMDRIEAKGRALRSYDLAG